MQNDRVNNEDDLSSDVKKKSLHDAITGLNREFTDRNCSRTIGYMTALGHCFNLNATTTFFLSQLIFWTGKGRKGNIVWKTYKEWMDEARLTRSNVNTARRDLEKLGLLESQNGGAHNRTHYRIKGEELIERFGQYLLKTNEERDRKRRKEAFSEKVENAADPSESAPSLSDPANYIRDDIRDDTSDRNRRTIPPADTAGVSDSLFRPDSCESLDDVEANWIIQDFATEIVLHRELTKSDRLNIILSLKKLKVLPTTRFQQALRHIMINMWETAKRIEKPRAYLNTIVCNMIRDHRDDNWNYIYTDDSLVHGMLDRLELDTGLNKNKLRNCLKSLLRADVYTSDLLDRFESEIRGTRWSSIRSPEAFLKATARNLVKEERKGMFGSDEDSGIDGASLDHKRWWEEMKELTRSRNGRPEDRPVAAAS